MKLSQRPCCCWRYNRLFSPAQLMLVSTGICIILYLALYNTRSQTNAADMSEILRGKVIEKILKVADNLYTISAEVHQSKARSDLMKQFHELNGVLSILGKGVSSKPKSVVLSSKPVVSGTLDVCPERWVFKDLDGGYPLFYEGFNLINCTNAPKFHTILTLVYNFVRYNDEDLKRVSTVIREVNRLYPQLAVIAAVPTKLVIKPTDFNDIQILPFQESTSEADVWRDLIQKVKTRYVYVGRNVVHFSRFDRLERLVRQINRINAYVVASAFRTLRRGQWSNGCYQTKLLGYNLAYRHGYQTSLEECLLCHHVDGPFVAKTELFSKSALPAHMTGISSFAMWFLKLGDAGRVVVSCPDSMSYVTDNSRLPTSKEDWKDLARSLQVERVYPHPSQLIEFTCDEADVGCPKVMKPGLALSYCCKKELADGINLVMSKCQEEGMLCELHAGTMLGAVKFNDVLPWELDADLKLHVDNYTVFAEKLKPVFTSLGYNMSSHKEESINRDYYLIFTPRSRWKIELYTHTIMGSALMEKEGLNPTVIAFADGYVRTSESPGLYARNSYGEEIYQHVQHYSQVGIPAYQFYGAKEFKKCPYPGRHYCLDQYVSDGNMMFWYPVT